MSGRRPFAADVLLGAAAGAAATWLMDRATTAILERQSEETRDREDLARGDRTAYEIAAEKSARLAGRELTGEERKKAGQAIHWSMGIAAGALYGAIRNRARGLGPGSGLAYGVAFFLMVDEGAQSLLGLTPPPDRFPWQTHARGLAGHLVLGAALEAPFDLADLVA